MIVLHTSSISCVCHSKLCWQRLVVYWSYWSCAVWPLLGSPLTFMILYFLGIRLTIFSILEQTRYINHGKLIPAMTVNEMKWTMGFYAIFVYTLAKLGQENLLRMVRWHCPPDTGFEIEALAVWGRARYFSVTEAPHNIASLRVSGEEQFCVFETWGPKWSSNPRSPTFQTGNFRDNQDNQGQVKRSRTTMMGQTLLLLMFESTRW